ncbi:hypothetical protein Anapl_09267 [Anas platyrhynchos]|uniref:Uncharacterized protein n=1 Tax=Anas platyrhynchos TaxID=8839 RepID=R0LS13_ANAPL|nr:hypothetical protein Anapl_09267 [Anas platyrhynchos]
MTRFTKLIAVTLQGALCSVQTDHRPALQQSAVHITWGTEGPAVGGVQRARRRIAAMKKLTRSSDLSDYNRIPALVFGFYNPSSSNTEGSRHRASTKSWSFTGDIIHVHSTARLSLSFSSVRNMLSTSTAQPALSPPQLSPKSAPSWARREPGSPGAPGGGSGDARNYRVGAISVGQNVLKRGAGKAATEGVPRTSSPSGRADLVLVAGKVLGLGNEMGIAGSRSDNEQFSLLTLKASARNCQSFRLKRKAHFSAIKGVLSSHWETGPIRTARSSWFRRAGTSSVAAFLHSSTLTSSSHA